MIPKPGQVWKKISLGYSAIEYFRIIENDARTVTLILVDSKLRPFGAALPGPAATLSAQGTSLSPNIKWEHFEYDIYEQLYNEFKRVESS